MRIVGPERNKRGAVYIDPEIQVGALINRLGVSREEFLANFENGLSEYGIYNTRDKKGFWLQKIKYTNASRIAQVLGVSTTKDLRYEYEKQNLIFPHPLEKYAKHDERFDLIDTDLLPIYYFNPERDENRTAGSWNSPYRHGGNGHAENLFDYLDQVDEHINHMSTSLQIERDQYLERLQQGYLAIEEKEEYDLIDTHDILAYMVAGLQYRSRYEDTWDFFVEKFGSEDEAKLMILLFAATSINTQFKANVKECLKAREYLDGRGMFLGGLTSVNERVDLIKDMREKYQAGEGEFHNPMPRKPSAAKVYEFAEAMMGDPDGLAIDLWIMRAYRVDQNRGLPAKIRNQIVKHINLIAKHIGREPREIQAVMWCGIRLLNSSNDELPMRMRDAWPQDQSSGLKDFSKEKREPMPSLFKDIS